MSLFPDRSLKRKRSLSTDLDDVTPKDVDVMDVDLFVDSFLDSPVPETLAKRLIASFCSGISSFDTDPPYYLPHKSIEEVITDEAVDKELRRSAEELARPGRGIFPEHLRRQICQWITEKANKVFAITVECDLDISRLIIAMRSFYQNGFDNSRLPISDPKSVAMKDQFDERIWSQAGLINFYIHQWKYLVPVFTPQRYDYDLHSKTIFPFTLQSNKSRIGGFSSVYKVSLHADHQEHYLMPSVAIKEIKMGAGKDPIKTNAAWEQEAKALKDINDLVDHDHILKCIAAIRRGNNRYFMFPWADGDSLRDFWNTKPTQVPSKSVILHSILQLRGIADALDRLHNFSEQLGDIVEDEMVEERDDEMRPDIPKIVNEDTDEVLHEERVEQGNIRHGDLKPENILVFSDPQNKTQVFKIADMGLAKKHIARTEKREHPTSTMYGTMRYEAPETMTSKHGKRSRLYDIWSMGCITLEFIIWMLYGNNALLDFNKQMDTQQVSQYFEVPTLGELGRAEVHPFVRRWMDHLQDKDPECKSESAIRDLLDIVRTKLLIVPLPPHRASTFEGGPGLAPPPLGESKTYYRATAAEFRDALDEILNKVSRPGYLLTGKDRSGVKTPSPSSNLLSPIVAFPNNAGPSMPKINVPQQEEALPGLHVPQKEQSLTGLLGRNHRLVGWEFPVDNQFAEKVFDRTDNLGPWPTVPSKLCARCDALDFMAGGFTFKDQVLELEKRSKDCDLCTLLHSCCSKNNVQENVPLRFERNQSKIMMNHGPMPALSIFRSPNLRTPPPIQIGSPVLPYPGTQAFYKIVKSWLDDCDTHHKDCHVIGKSKFPTRLIDVGTLDDPQLRLLETSDHEKDFADKQYIAISHPWGDATKWPPFNTLRKDKSGAGHDIDHFKQAIPFDQLPATFRDAVQCARALAIRYLWIDSICIIQGKDGDFAEEAKRMEDVYSGAYCVFAASRAKHQHDGFLKARPQPSYVTLLGSDRQPFYLCQAVDDFSQDVLEGSLNRRGWVLQERALARRTIYFTENQTYFECGNGVRCETMTKMHNNMADFLGDPNFPVKAMTESRGLKISYFKDLYQTYSRLDFTREYDRPFAIAGIEKRLQAAYNTKGGYGIFDDGPDGGLFHRSLLWKRGEKAKDADNDATEKKTDNKVVMQLIDFPAERNIRVPSWSWMAYTGGIDYTDPPFQTAEWVKDEISPPWTRGEDWAWSTESAPQTHDIALSVLVRNFSVARKSKDEVELTYDIERTASDGQRTQCVIVARSRVEKLAADKTHYVLLVAPEKTLTKRGDKVYRRVGAGFMPGKYIALDEPGIPAKIY
ncbi:hypothetical protein N0V90_010613 [Kalmusia sp. IMI 367209]|nr:hypothetical protein N0V90_010613 [Kalmusia sp. IMI 367209]